MGGVGFVESFKEETEGLFGFKLFLNIFEVIYKWYMCDLCK